MHVIRVQVRLTILFLFVALSASGLGNIVASTLCAHITSAEIVENQENNHACCPAGDNNQESHCDATSGHTHKASQQEIQEPKPVYVATAQESSFQVIPPCDHCIGRSEPVQSFVMLREKVQPQRVTDAPPPSASRSHHGHQFSFKLPVITRQGAPPGAPTRRNILFSIFLI